MEKYDGKLTIDEIQIDDKFIFLLTGQESIVTNKTANSVETYDTADKKCVDKNGKLKGISCKNWHELSNFNRKYKKV